MRTPRKKSGRPTAQSAYVYGVLVDDVLRYIGKGRSGRASTHFLIAKRLIRDRAQGKRVRTSRFYNALASALKKRRTVAINILHTGLSDEDAYLLEARLISECPHGQLWNVIAGGKGGDPEFFRRFWLNPSNRLAASEKTKAKWQDPEYRKRGTEILRARSNTLKFREFRSADMRARFQDDAYRQRHSDATRKRWLETRPELLRCLQAGKEAAREKFSEATRKKWMDPVWRAKLCAAQKARWTPEARNARSEKLKVRMNDPVTKAKLAETSRANWKDPEYRARQTAALAKAREDKRNRQ